MIKSLHGPIAALCLLAAILPTAVRADENTERTQKLNGGYFLLYKLCQDEDQLPLLLVVKHAPPEIGKFADDISKVSKASLASLDQMKDADPALNFDRNPLPQIEQDVRGSIKEDKQHQLLFGTSGSEFVRALLISQIEACTYATHLAKVLGDQDPKPAHAKALDRIQTQWLSLRHRAYQMLRDS